MGLASGGINPELSGRYVRLKYPCMGPLPDGRSMFGAIMCIHRFLQESTVHPDDISCVVEAYDQTLRTLSLSQRDDALTEIVAKTVIRVSEPGIRDPMRISEMAI